MTNRELENARNTFLDLVEASKWNVIPQGYGHDPIHTLHIRDREMTRMLDALGIKAEAHKTAEEALETALKE